MSTAFALLFLIIGQALLANGVQSKVFFGVGQRIAEDQLLLKDVLNSRPAGIGEPASVLFNYNITEPITYIEFVSEENISAEVKFSYTDSLVTGVVSLVASEQVNGTESSTGEAESLAIQEAIPPLPTEFNVLITIFGLPSAMTIRNAAMLLNRDQQFEGALIPYDDFEVIERVTEALNNIQRDELQVDIDNDQSTTEEPNETEDFEFKDKIIEIGERQAGDDMIYETYQTSTDGTDEKANHTTVFYYIDSDYITYVKFVIFGHFADKVSTDADYTAPLAEYSHYSPGTLKATITDFNVKSLFVQMFVYGYRGRSAPPDYKPFLPPPHWQRPDAEVRAPVLTPAQRLQLLLLTGKATTENPPDDYHEEDDEVEPVIRPEELIPDHEPSAALDPVKPVEQRLYAMLGLMLFAIA